MGPLTVFSARDVRRRSGELLRNAEHGRLTLITRHGHPAILAVPFDERLLEVGVHRAMALRLFEQRLVTLVQAARLAATTPEEFVDMLGTARLFGRRLSARGARRRGRRRVVTPLVADTGP